MNVEVIKHINRLDLYILGVKLDHNVYNPVLVGLLYVVVKNFPLL